MTTILGSCVAACIRDPLAGVGGINHFLLPGNSRPRESGRSRTHGRPSDGTAGQRLAQGRRPARAARGKALRRRPHRSGHTDIGKHNVEFAERFLRDEGISSRRWQHRRLAGAADSVLAGIGTCAANFAHRDLQIERPVRIAPAAVVDTTPANSNCF